jgi:outer membrane receptor protein involved in Fe transport
MNRALSAFPRLPTRVVTDQFFPVCRAETEASGKLNPQLTPGNSIMLRYAFTNNRESGDAFNTAGWTDPSARGSAFTRDHAAAGALTTLFDPESVGDLRFQIAGRHVVLRTNDAAGPEVTIAGLIELGRPYDGNGRRDERHDQITYTYTRGSGHHFWKAGATVNHVREDAAMEDGLGGTYLFATLADFAGGHANEYRQAFGPIATGYAVTSLGGFLTDKWSVAQKWTLDLGLRYDFEFLPGGFRENTHNFSPRVGLAYHVAPRWVLRAGYGIFFDRYILASLHPALQRNGAGGWEQVLTGVAAANVFHSTGGGALSLPIPGVAPSIYRVDRNLATPYSQRRAWPPNAFWLAT